MGVVEACRRVLLQKECLLSGLERLGLYEAYSAKCSVVGASIGAHIRHSLDHYQKAVESIAGNGENQGLAKYDVRERGSSVENDLNAAIEAIMACSTKLGKLSDEVLENKKVNVEFKLSGDGSDGMCKFESTALRELWFVAHHSIHHQAMIKLIVANHPQSEKLSKAIPKDFGMAPSTVAHLKKCTKSV